MVADRYVPIMGYIYEPMSSYLVVCVGPLYCDEGREVSIVHPSIFRRACSLFIVIMSVIIPWESETLKRAHTSLAPGRARARRPP